MTEKKKLGLVYSIQRYCIHDGPGIRTNIFFKGCGLRCPWCSNPESQGTAPELSFVAGKCVGCGMCYEKCLPGALRTGTEFRIDTQKCTLCGACVRYCVQDCYKLYGKYYTAEELCAEAIKDGAYYRNSGGGVTVTGGEPMMQFDFLLEFLKQCRENELDTAMETHGFIEPEKYRAVAPYVDHFLIDVKSMDLEKCHRLLCAPREYSPLENIRMLTKECGREVSIRVPVIPGFNDEWENFRSLGAFAQEIQDSGHLKMIHLLPYHIMGSAKYETLNRVYQMKGTKVLGDEAVVPFQKYLAEAGLPCTIGG